ncbi:hypothetical protein JCM10296v2_001545 [Rhodotorula toruloides]
MADQPFATRPFDCIDAITRLHFTLKNRSVDHAFTGLAGNLVLAVEVPSGSLQQARNALHRLELEQHSGGDYFELVSHVPGPQPSQVVCQFLLETHHPSQRTHNDPWHPQECRIERGPQTFRIPTEPVVEAQCRCFSAECFAQIIANDYIHQPHLYDLNPSEWVAEVARLFSQAEYHMMQDALFRLVEHTLVQRGDRFIRLLALSAAIQEECETHNRWVLPAEDDERMNKLTRVWSEIFKLVIQCFRPLYASEILSR